MPNQLASLARSLRDFSERQGLRTIKTFGIIIGVSDENNEVYREWIEIPKVEEFFYPLVSAVPLQMLAYHLAVSRGKDPDRPRNLAKSVTVK